MYMKKIILSTTILLLLASCTVTKQQQSNSLSYQQQAENPTQSTGLVKTEQAATQQESKSETSKNTNASTALAQKKTGNDYNPYQHPREEYIKEGEFFIEQYRKVNCDDDEIKESIQDAIEGYYQGKYSDDEFGMIFELLGHMCCPEIIDFFADVITIDTSERMRCGAIQTLGALRAESKIPFLIDYAKNNPSEQEKIKIALSLCVMKAYEEAIKIADLFCYDEDGYVREECIAIYEFAGEREAALKHYRRFFENLKGEQYLLFAAQKLAEYGDYEKAYPIFIKFLSSTDKYKIMGALRGLAMIGDEKSIQVLKEQTKSENQVAAKESQNILNRIEQGRRKK